ncbi:unnamed protein product [Rhizoctonia solani]|uniref:Uncharacterized protein n=1 Tax=Rhizoctonia solani TaxID=456999 RepID=A0A8H3I1W1_9AGAM|nr:unnamed protein product [Rhizoctonia solani]
MFDVVESSMNLSFNSRRAALEWGQYVCQPPFTAHNAGRGVMCIACGVPRPSDIGTSSSTNYEQHFDQRFLSLSLPPSAIQFAANFWKTTSLLTAFDPCSDRPHGPPLSTASDLALSPRRSAKATSAR